MSVKLIKQNDAWTIDFLGKLRHFIMLTDLTTWRSLGILPNRVVEFDVTGNTLNSIKDFTNNIELTELELPDTHAVAQMITATKPYIVQEEKCLS